jgi:hypothetical protein
MNEVLINDKQASRVNILGLRVMRVLISSPQQICK